MAEDDIEKVQPQREMIRIDVETSMQRAADRMKFQQELGVAGNRAIMLSNGGAIVALPTFIGNADATFNSVDLKNAFLMFLLGITSALVSFIMSYAGQEWLSNSDKITAWNRQLNYPGRSWEHDQTKERNMGWGLMLTAATSSLSGVVSFAAGYWFSLEGILP